MDTDKKTPNHFPKFSKLLDAHIAKPHEFCATHFGVYEKIGLNVPKLTFQLPKHPPQATCDPRTVKAFGQDVCNVLSYLRDTATAHFKTHITEKVLKDRESDQRQNYWKNDQEAISWIDKLLPIGGNYRPLAKDLVDLLSVDFQHSYPQLPKAMEGPIQALMALTLGVEYRGDSGIPRNIVLGRIFKKMWLSRVQTGDKLSVEAVQKFHEAMTFKNSADFVDLEITYMSLVGYYQGGAYRPVTCITSDPSDKIQRRILIMKEVIEALNDDVFPATLPDGELTIRYCPGNVIVVDRSLEVVEVIRASRVRASNL